MKKLILLSALLAFVSPVMADGRRDLYFQQSAERYFNFPTTARNLGLASSSVATASDASAVVGNPAALGLMKQGDFALSYGESTVSGNEHPNYKEIEQETGSGSVLAAIPVYQTLEDFPEFGNIGLGWSGYSGDYDGDAGDMENNGYRVHFAYAYAFNEKTSIGYGLTYFNDELKSSNFEYPMDNGFRHTVGLASNYTDNLKLGGDFYIGHGSHDVTLITDNQTGASDLFEFGFEMGAAYKVAEMTTLHFSGDYQRYNTDGDITLASEASTVGGSEDGQAFGVRLGVEQVANDWLTLRAGYRYQANLDYNFDRDELDILGGSAKYNAWTLGAGLSLPVDGKYIHMVKLDYGVEYRSVGYLDWEHMITLSVPFNTCDNAA